MGSALTLAAAFAEEPARPWPPDDTVILRGRPVRAGTPADRLSRFGDAVWHLRPGHPDAHQVVNSVHWSRWPAPLVLPFKTFALAALEHPLPVTTTMGSDGDLMSVDTLSGKLGELRILATWMDQQKIAQISDLSDIHLDHYRSHVLALATSKERKGSLLRAVRTLWEYRRHLPRECQMATADPWNGASGMSLAKVPAKGRENKTPRIDAATMEALLAWSLHMLEDIGPDILTAHREFQMLEDGTHPDQAPYLGLRPAAALKLFMERAVREGRTLPGYRASGRHDVNWRHLGRLVGAGGVTAPGSRKLVRNSGLPVAEDVDLGTVTGRIDGVPWRDKPITLRELPLLIRYLTAACFVIISYLSGMRPGEALNLQRGCSRRDEATGQLLIDGRRGKGAGRQPRIAEAEDDMWGRSWVVVQPVHDAISMLEALSASPFLFPSSFVSAQTSRPAEDHARAGAAVTRDLNEFTTWINSIFVQPDGQPPIPPDPTRRVHPSRFRRTLAYFIVRRPRGLVAAALQYGHVATKVTLSYAGASNTSWMEDLAVERLELLVEQSEEDWRLLGEGERISGPSASEYKSRVTRTRQFVGRAISRTRNIERFLAQVDPSIHHGEGMTCVWRAETAACRNTRLAQGLPANDAPDEAECQSSCQNLAYTDRDIAQLREQLVVLETGAADLLAPRPLRDRAAAQAAQMRKVLDRHDAVTPAAESAEESTS
ncbi:integrase [Streptomyces adelaidensis]|uniref:integrase n=1 Tax=Streptomyces adelaidensis TaxID=2796465 RepID=UPI0019088680|nr:integrase [Streptomyces adelaidensis]